VSELAGSLLQVITRENRAPKKKGGTPLFMEFPVNAALTPFLVTRASSGDELTLWVDRIKGGQVKAGLRDLPSLEDYFLEVVLKTAERSVAEDWGSVNPMTREGLIKAKEHLNDYGFADDQIEILSNPEMPWWVMDPGWDNRGKGMVLSLIGLPVQPARWVPKDIVLVVPRDREMVGFVFLTYQKVASVVHNTVRGIGIASSRSFIPEDDKG
jgi:hypothetical protein